MILRIKFSIGSLKGYFDVYFTSFSTIKLYKVLSIRSKNIFGFLEIGYLTGYGNFRENLMKKQLFS